MDIYHSVPEGAGLFPAVVVSHHGGGIDRFIQEIADKLAAEGYAAVAPDLFHRITEGMLSDGAPRINHLRDPEVVADINATVQFLRNHPSVDGQRIGVIGFCMGGRVTWLAATTNPSFVAAVPYYGGNIKLPWGEVTGTPFDLSDSISCPVLFHFGEIDQNPSQEDMRELDSELTRLGKPHRFYTYPGADHAFMDHTASRYQKEATQVSWFRTLEFLAQHLKEARVA
jgi:carboxymethylenebutenolidase